MLRRALLAAADSARLRAIATNAPIARGVARRFVAGEDLDDALAVVRTLNRRGLRVTLDYLGEDVRDEALARAALEVYRRALKRIADDELACSVSVKLTQLGLDVDEGLCRELLAEVAAAAAEVDTHVTVDMEGSTITQRTIDIVLALRVDGHRNVGCAVQSYLHRTVDDVRRLAADGASLRLCKGAYDEPDDIAWQRREEIDAAYRQLASLLLATDTFPRFATHDHRLIHWIRNEARRRARPDDAYEFQMLYGIREPLQQSLLDRGHPVRIYVPFGEEWYPYLVRRLAERPANLAFFLRALAGGRANASPG